MHGSNALLSIQQTHREIADKLWDICFSYNLVNTPVKELIRHGWKPVYHFKTFTMPYFTRLFNAWYTNIDGKCIKVIPSGIAKLLTPIALAHWIMRDL
uniref:LAGLIDADG endonuclease family protein n=1 Tax=Rhizoctonia solani TaxID=456999 RepID=N0A3A6_9AGAM|nr:LAGLIDADG endonuclease family protein [Rhizoctonia solani]AGK45454.1 LAGLIDADG endonuclease family protein [Rhizoctonia solani]